MLEESVKRRITERYQQMSGDGELLSKSQLDQFYSTFRSRFGPDKLANLDGEALLESMHSIGNRDSLVYWLEFKNDDEFPARFGSIAGGSALKFGIFRRKETNEWETSDKKLSVQEAVVIARKHRDQLLLGVEALHQLPSSGGDDDYKTLQERLDRDAPDVSDLAWATQSQSLCRMVGNRAGGNARHECGLMKGFDPCVSLLPEAGISATARFFLRPWTDFIRPTVSP